MTHQVLARKWRPRDFASLVGQEHVVRALSHALETARLHHAYLFTGTRGVGKTTIARILAKSLNCETGLGPQPCGKCRACTEIDDGRFPDYLELDAASNRGVDEMAQLLDNAVYSPVSGRYKVYVIDEVHMLTTHAFNAMLKTLEEPPGHVIFILATTDPQKVPVTVLSRCLQFNLKNMPASMIAQHLGQVLQAEQVEFESAALTQIGRAASGSMRDALSLLDQAIAYGGGRVVEQDVRDMLGVVDRRYLQGILDALLAEQGADLVAIADEMLSSNAPFGRTLADLASWLQRIALAQVGALGADEDDADALHRYGELITPENLQVYYQIAIHGARDLSLAPDEHTGFSMTLLRLLAFRPSHSGSGGGSGEAIGSQRTTTPKSLPRATTQTHAQADSLRASAVIAPSPHPALQAAATAPVLAPPTQRQGAPASGSPAADALAAAAAAVASARRQVSPAVRPVARESRDTNQAGRPQSAPAAGPAGEPAANPGEPEEPGAQLAAEITDAGAQSSTRSEVRFDGNWPRLASMLGLGGLALQFMQQSELISHEGLSFRVRVPIRPLAEPQTLGKVREALAGHFGAPVQLSVQVGGVTGETAAAVASRERAERLEQARVSLEADPFVQTLLTDFGGRILPDSVKPIDPSPDASGSRH